MAKWPEEAEIHFCQRCVELINFGSMKSGMKNLSSLLLDDLQEELLELLKWSTKNKWIVFVLHFTNFKQFFL
jgi:hypothetical protein